MRSIACAVARSVAIVTPASTPASIAAATASPSTVDDGPAVPPSEAPPREPGDVARRPHVVVPRRRRYAVVLVRLPQMRHRAPARGAVARCVVEEPAAAVLAARLHPLPRSRCLRVHDHRCDRAEHVPGALSRRREQQCPVRAEIEPQRDPGKRREQARTDALAGRDAERVQQRELTEHRTQLRVPRRRSRRRGPRRRRATRARGARPRARRVSRCRPGQSRGSPC